MPPLPEIPAEAELRDWLERLRWPHGPVCPRCRWQAPAPAAGRKIYRCRAVGCRLPFTVTLGTVLERTHQPLTVWWKAVSYLTAAEKGLTVRQLQKLLALPYRSTWSMMERLRKIAPRHGSPFTLAPFTPEEIFTRLMARPYILPQERFERLERQASRIEALSKRPGKDAYSRQEQSALPSRGGGPKR